MTLDLTTVNMGVFYNREMGRAKIYLYTKFEVSSFTRSIFRDGVPKFKNLALDPYHAPYGGIFQP